MRQSKPVRRPSQEKGSLLVETSLILLVFMVGIVGIFDCAQFLFMHQTLTERIRAGLRWASVNAYSETAVRNMVLYSDPTPEAGATPVFHLNPSMVVVSRQNSGQNEDRIVIAIRNYPFQFVTPGIARQVRGKEIAGSIPYEFEH